MYHVVFCANDNYIKYLAPLCYSIVKNTANNTQYDKGESINVAENITMGGGGKPLPDSEIIVTNITDEINNTPQSDNKSATQDRQKPFCFHILTDGLKHETQQKLQAFQIELNKIYPCKFRVYTLSDSIFQGLPKLNNNYLAYFRLKIASCLPQDIKTCLYLDVDMICVADIREIFYTDLQGKICGVVLDPIGTYYHNSNIKSKNMDSKVFVLNNHTYFNSGFMFIDLEKYRQHDVEAKCFEWLSQYIPEMHDQDTLNAILSDYICVLPLEWNFILVLLRYKQQDFMGESENAMLTYTYQEYKHAKDNPMIFHYAWLKPWRPPFIENDTILTCNYKNKWWEIAHDTPVFYKDIYSSYMKKQEDMLYESILSLQKHIKSFKLRNRLKRLQQSLKRRCKKLFHIED